MRNILVKNIINSQFKGGKFLRYDLVVIYLFIKNFYKKGKPKSFRYKPYDLIYKAKEVSKKHIKKEYSKFFSLISSFEEKGYDKEFPITMNKRHYICSGSHRIVLSIWFGIKEVPVVFNERCRDRKRRHSSAWMRKNGFEKYFSQLKKTKKIILKRVGVNDTS